jgi:hypothetical protein
VRHHDHVTDIADELYSAPPHEFIARRDAAVKAAKAAGDATAAGAIKDLRKPTVGAWVVNLLALERPDLIEELADLSASMLDAQRRLKGKELRELSQSRRAVVAKLVTAGGHLAVEADPSLDAGKLPNDHIAATLQAAFADAEVATAVRAGRLVKTSSYTGFGDMMPGYDPGADEPVRDRAVSKAPEKAGKAARKAGQAAIKSAAPTHQQRHAAKMARKAAQTAQRDLDQAATAIRRSVATLADAEAVVADLRKRLATAEKDVDRAGQAKLKARDAHARAEKALADAERHAEKTEAEVAAATT